MSTKGYGGIIDAAAVAGNALTSNGATAPTMQACPRFYSGSGVPASTIGFNGDAYFDTAGQNLYQKATGSWGVVSALAPKLAQSVSGLIGTTATATWSASGSTASWTVPATVNGQTVTKLVVTDVVARLLSGTPGTSATWGVSISGNTAAGASRVLPTAGGGVDVALINLNTQNISASYKQANPGDSITFTSGGTFSGSTTWQFDIFGYYVGISTTGVASLLQAVSAAGTFNLGASGTTYMVTAATANTTLVATAANTLAEHIFVVEPGNVLAVNAPSGGVIRAGSLGNTTAGNIVLTGPGSVWLVGVPSSTNWTLKGGYSGFLKVN